MTIQLWVHQAFLSLIKQIFVFSEDMTKRIHGYTINYFWFEIEVFFYCSKQYSCLAISYFCCVSHLLLVHIVKSVSFSEEHVAFWACNMYSSFKVSDQYCHSMILLLNTKICWQCHCVGSKPQKRNGSLSYLGHEVYLCQSVVEIFSNILLLGFFVNPQRSALSLLKLEADLDFVAKALSF